jgi:hypothetical protein
LIHSTWLLILNPNFQILASFAAVLTLGPYDAIAGANGADGDPSGYPNQSPQAKRY